MKLKFQMKELFETKVSKKKISETKIPEMEYSEVWGDLLREVGREMLRPRVKRGDTFSPNYIIFLQAS